MGNLAGTSRPTGGVALLPIRPPRTAVPQLELSLKDIAEHGFAHAGLDRQVRTWRAHNLPHLWRGMRRVLAARALHLPGLVGQLSLVHIRPDGTWEDLGLASLRVVTDAGVAYIAARMADVANPANINLFIYHGIGTGGTAESAAQTALVTELTTQYATDNTRATGTRGNSTNTYTTLGINTVDASVAITEHGVFTQAATGGGTMLDRSLFAVVNLSSGDSLSSTYTLTLSSGG